MLQINGSDPIGKNAFDTVNYCGKRGETLNRVGELNLVFSLLIRR